jgi:hypothetical protein
VLAQEENEITITRRISTQVLAALIASVMIGVTLFPVGSSAAPSAPRATPEHVVGAVGDICGTHLAWNNPQRSQYDNVADLLMAMGIEKFLMLGDAQHEDGLLSDYYKYYDSQFGKLLPITAPVPGNHDYYWDAWQPNNPHTTYNASGYFGYFGDIAYPPYGFYSFDLGSWHFIALNSPLMFDYNMTEPGNPANLQYEWLKADLASHPNTRYPGTIVFFHHPLYDWETPNAPGWASPELITIWDLLYKSGVDLVLNGHSHTYQRWAPEDAYGNYQANGVREFVVGTGGYYMNNLGHNPKPANFVWGQDQDFGALKLSLYRGSYDFQFVSIDGKVLDSGNVPCN